jgi:ribosomal protein S18 acetylase RimI-like enzyme
MATEADLPATDALERAHFTSHHITFRQFKYLQRNPRATFLVATKKGEIVGDAIALIRRGSATSPSGRIYSIVVDPAHRGEKIGQKLMARLLDGLKQRKVARVSLEVDKSNAGAIGLYERLGFRISSLLPHYYGRAKHGVRMTLDLNSL